MKSKNIIFIIIDGARYYPGKAADNAGRPLIFEELAKESCYFTKVVSTAPSTIMSFSSIFTGFPAGYLARNFNDFKFDNRLFNSLQSLLKNNGYNIYSTTYFPQGRNFLKNIIFPVNQSYWPDDLIANKNWENDAIERILNNIITKGIDQPFCLFLHFNIRWDKDISDRVRRSIDQLKQIGLYEDSFLIMCSDHGLPDPERKIPRHIMRDHGHDLIVTDDNIRIPLVVRHPGVEAHVVNDLVCTLDLMPTILEYAGVEYKNKLEIPLWGVSLLPLITGDEGSSRNKYNDRYIKTECRYMAQPNRIISLRSKNHKYAFYYDEPAESREHFFDLKNDPDEKYNLINTEDPVIKKQIEDHRINFKNEEKKVDQFHKSYLIEEFKDRFEALGTAFNDAVHSPVKIIILRTYSLNFIDILVEAVKCFYTDPEIVLIYDHSEGLELLSDKYSTLIEAESDYTSRSIKKILENMFASDNPLILVPLDDEKTVKFYNKLFKTLKTKTNRVLFVDCNMDIHSAPKRREIPFGSNPAIPLVIRTIYKKMGFYYYRRYWYFDDLKYYLNKMFPFLKLEVKRYDVD